MAKQKDSFLGGFEGSLGPAVGYRWMGRWCVRSKATQVRNPRTEAQQQHRSLFVQQVRLASTLGTALRLGMRVEARRQGLTAPNLFLKLNREAMSQSGEGQLQVDLNVLQLSAGRLPTVRLTDVQVDADGVLQATFLPNPEGRWCASTDHIYMVAYAVAEGLVSVSLPVRRHQGWVAMQLPAAMRGCELELYAFARNLDGICSPTTHYSRE